MKVKALRNFSYGFGMVLIDEELYLSDEQAAELIQNGFAEAMPEEGFKEMIVKESKPKKAKK